MVSIKSIQNSHLLSYFMKNVKRYIAKTLTFEELTNKNNSVYKAENIIQDGGII